MLASNGGNKISDQSGFSKSNKESPGSGGALGNRLRPVDRFSKKPAIMIKSSATVVGPSFTRFVIVLGTMLVVVFFAF